MLTIKRYTNRKLYDTDARKYVRLDEISELIRSGREIEVIDNTTGDDLTAVILTQIIYEQEKKNSGFLPRSVLQSLVKSGGNTLNSLRTGLSYPLNLVAHVDEEIRRRVDTLVKEGEIALEDGQQMIQNLITDAGSLFQDATSGSDFFERLKLLGIPSRSEIDDLKQQIQTLEEALLELVPNPEPEKKKLKG
ncbi:MAG: polyhydroxyalkanoate synthesis repressor PhaR [Cellvibrionaceae bacterium]|jgi:polyhydroxyalkanoate synthesis repressor PhaR